MKKVILLLGFLLTVNSICNADEIIQPNGSSINCKIISVEQNYIEYKKDGCPVTFARTAEHPVFNDYVDVRTNLAKKNSVVRYSGLVEIKDFQELVLSTSSGKVRIPWYKVKKIGIYNSGDNNKPASSAEDSL